MFNLIAAAVFSVLVWGSIVASAWSAIIILTCKEEG